MDGFVAANLATLPLDHVGRVLPMADGRWLVHRSEAGELLVVDAELAPVWRLPLPARTHAHATHAVTEDCSLAALSMLDHVRVVDGGGQEVARFPHPHWPFGSSGCCAFSPDPRYLWATVPPRPEKVFRTGDELWLIDRRVWWMIDWVHLRTAAAGCEPVQHPDGQTVGLSVGEGQDGSLMRWARAHRGQIELRFGPDDRVLVAVHPDGDEYLATPHPGSTHQLTRHRFVDDRPIERLAAADALGADQAWDLSAGYLTDTLILGSVVSVGGTALRASRTCWSGGRRCGCSDRWSIRAANRRARSSERTRARG